ncbi:hypothetical protein VN97_g3721 [Penicillium thymicola]|uniref:Uncharacterized protein n=1 Tax=Penicillium thymicola TaxID=293382 RepID=A0AAI9XA70_PENTH|nr:hypothetical protein VN97_g3721 [Penicillium thymicola]
MIVLTCFTFIPDHSVLFKLLHIFNTLIGFISSKKVGHSIIIALSSWKKLRVSLVVCLGVLSYITIGSYSLLRRKKPSIIVRII